MSEIVNPNAVIQQTQEEITGIYIAWKMGAEIECSNTAVNPEWEPHESYDFAEGFGLDAWHIYKIATGKYKSEDVKSSLRCAAFRLRKPAP